MQLHPAVIALQVNLLLIWSQSAGHVVLQSVQPRILYFSRSLIHVGGALTAVIAGIELGYRNLIDSPVKVVRPGFGAVAIKRVAVAVSVSNNI